MSIKCAKVSSAKVQIGAYDASKLSLGQFGANGVLTNPGISIFGESFQVGIMRAGVTIGPPQAIPGLTLPASLEVTGVANYFGLLEIFGITNAFGFVTGFGGRMENGISIKNGVDVKSAFNIGLAASNFSGPTVCNAPLSAPTVTAPVGFIKINNGKCTGNKPFDIPHWKGEGKRVRHVCAEGPEAGIYIRGRLKDSNVIQLPEYWDGLVDYDSISVQLQPIGDRHYHINVIEIDKEKVVVKEADDKPFECFYHVWVARWIDPRNHDEKLHVVYDGESPDDYPGNNENFLIGGWDYDHRETQWGNE
jgi:hypothetical protein